MRSLVASSIVDGVLTMTFSSEVNSSISVEVSNVAVGQVLELGEVKDGTSLAIQGLDVVRSFTISFEVGLGLDVGDVDLVDQVLEAVVSILDRGIDDNASEASEGLQVLELVQGLVIVHLLIY